MDDDDDDEVPVLVTYREESPLQSVTEFEGIQSSRTAAPDGTQQPTKSPDKNLPPCPVTILSGFLGAGKTTLVQYILQSPDHGKRIAVIENEFGGGDDDNVSGGGGSAALSIESLIARDGLTSNSLQDLIELPNGCICCTVKDSLVVTLEMLLTKRADLDYILIECTGLANPGPIASVFWLDDALESRLRLDGIVTLVDAVRIEQQLRETVEASQQIAYADRILLNKMDLLTKESSIRSTSDSQEIDRLCQVIRSINATADIQSTTYAAVPNLDWLLDAQCFDAERAHTITSLPVSSTVDAMSGCQPHAQISCEHGHLHPSTSSNDTDMCHICSPSSSDAQQQQQQQHAHTADVSTTALIIRGSVHVHKVHQWLAAILDGSSTNYSEASHGANPSASKLTREQQVFRLKGILSVWFVPSDDEGHESAKATIEDQTTGTSSSGEILDPRRFVVQGVYDLWDIHACVSTDLQWTATEERICKLIVIGRHLDALALQRGFEACQ